MVKDFRSPFRYERLPTFCYVCGKIRHDEKHCSVKQDGQEVDRQYGEWLKAGSTNKGDLSIQDPQAAKAKKPLMKKTEEVLGHM